MRRLLQPCTRWQLQVRLKRPRGLLNPGVADSERSALERGIVATGYVRDDPDNTRLAGPHWCVDGVRDAIARGIAARVRDPHDATLLQAFSVGDTRGLEQRDWEVARANGVSHLIAISGFHVGVAAVAGVWLAMLAYALCPRLALWLPRPQAQAAAALLVAGIYSALAGFGLPTVRTLLMIAVVALARCGRRGQQRRAVAGAGADRDPAVRPAGSAGGRVLAVVRRRGLPDALPAGARPRAACVPARAVGRADGDDGVTAAADPVVLRARLRWSGHCPTWSRCRS